VFSISAMVIAAGSPEIGAQVFHSGFAVFAFSAGGEYPRHAYTLSVLKASCLVATFHKTHYLVPWYHRISRRRGAAFYFIEFGVAYAAACNPDQDLPWPWDGAWHISQLQRRPGLTKVCYPIE